MDPIDKEAAELLRRLANAMASERRKIVINFLQEFERKVKAQSEN